jgi:hypothetical protein
LAQVGIKTHVFTAIAMLIQTKGYQKVHFLFSFGSHIGSDDFLNAKKAADKFKPHIYAPEGSNITRKERRENAVGLNHKIQRARNDSFLRQQILDNEMAWKAALGMKFARFSRDEQAYIIDSPQGLVHYPLEAHNSFSVTAMKKQEVLVSQAATSAYKGNLAAAIGKLIEAYGVGVKIDRKREEDIVTNMKTYLQEVLEMFPQLAAFNPIRVFSRLGTLHSSVYQRALEAFKGRDDIMVERVFDYPSVVFGPHDQLHRAIAHNKPVSEETALRALVYIIVYEAHMIKNGRTGDYSKLPHIVKVAYGLNPKQLEEAFTRNTGGSPDNWVLRVATEAEKLASASP